MLTTWVLVVESFFLNLKPNNVKKCRKCKKNKG